MRTRRKPETWLFPLLRSKRDLVSEAPARLTDEKKREWADRRHELDLAAAHELISSRLHPEAILSATFLSGELSFSIDGVRVVERVYVGEVEGEFILSQWKILAATFNVTENTDGRRFANALRRLAISDNPAVVQQVIALEVELSVVEDRISEEELSMEAMANQLYELSEADAKLIAG